MNTHLTGTGIFRRLLEFGLFGSISRHGAAGCLVALWLGGTLEANARVAESATAAAHPPIPVLNWEARSDWRNVKDAGAVGDGQADDTEAIQKVLDMAYKAVVVFPGEAFVLYFPAGEYRITAPLRIGGQQRLIGTSLIGHGRDTRLVWDGPDGGSMLVADGLSYARYEGVVFDGRGRAGVGLHHPNTFFVTATRYRHLALLNFTNTGILVDPKRAQAQAETSYENCYFENCGIGVSFRMHNDYNHTFTGCEFRDCGIGVDCRFGNFYVRNTHFANSRIADIRAHPEHPSSLRRVTSTGSRALLVFTNEVAPMVLQDVHVAGWTNPEGAVHLNGAPVTLFDAVFTNPPEEAAPPVRLGGSGQRLIMSNNRVDGTDHIVQPGTGIIHDIPPGRHGGSIQSASQRFIREQVSIPGKVFDAKRDFGAQADGRSDDTQAIQRTIDAARAHGNGALAYLPAGRYAVTATLRLSGRDYYFGGTSSFGTRLDWNGAEGGTLLHVEDAHSVTVKNMQVANEPRQSNAVDILQTGSENGSSVVYDNLKVFGTYQKEPFRKGLHLRGLGSRDQVVMIGVQGNLRIIDSAAATVLGDITYDGALTVEGRQGTRDGFLGFLTRMSTHNLFSLYVKDNHSIVLSDFYFEQADDGYWIEGAPDMPEGRVVMQGAKVCYGNGARQDDDTEPVTLEIRNYGGDIFLGADQFYVSVPRALVRHSGDRPVNLFLTGCFFYNSQLVVERADSTDALRLYLIGSNGTPGEEMQYDHRRDLVPADGAGLASALDDLRALGELDLRINFPHTLGKQVEE